MTRLKNIRWRLSFHYVEKRQKLEDDNLVNAWYPYANDIFETIEPSIFIYNMDLKLHSWKWKLYNGMSTITFCSKGNQGIPNQEGSNHVVHISKSMNSASYQYKYHASMPLLILEPSTALIKNMVSKMLGTINWVYYKYRSKLWYQTMKWCNSRDMPCYFVNEMEN